MPVRRSKSCVNCRRAKARCSLSAPCSRCATRSLACQYATALPPLRDHRPRGFRPIRPATDTTLNGSTVGSAINATSDTNLNAPVENEIRSPSMNIHEEAEIPTWLKIGTGTPPSDMTNFSDFNELFDVSESPTMAEPSHSLQTAHFPTFPDIISPRLLSLDFSTVFPGVVTPNSMDFNLGPKALEPQLSQRSRSLQQGSMTAKMIFSRMSDYGRMMADAKSLPPFIHPPCCLGSRDECSPNAAHTCLPEALAVCSNLAQMLYARRSGSQDFVWKQIRTHLGQLRDEYNGYDESVKLQALQAALVYGMLCAQCTESVSVEDSAWVVGTIETFAEELYDLGTWTLNVDQPCPSRSHWVFVESLRRVGCLLYLIDLLLRVDTQTPSRGDCHEFFDMPLPCSRELWQPLTDRDWRKRYQDDMETRKQKGRPGLTLGMLLLIRQSAACGEDITKSAREGLAEELAEWCERADDLSMLLWMGLTVEGDGQSQLYRVGTRPAPM